MSFSAYPIAIKFVWSHADLGSESFQTILASKEDRIRSIPQAPHTPTLFPQTSSGRGPPEAFPPRVFDGKTIL